MCPPLWSNNQPLFKTTPKLYFEWKNKTADTQVIYQTTFWYRNLKIDQLDSSASCFDIFCKHSCLGATGLCIWSQNHHQSLVINLWMKGAGHCYEMLLPFPMFFHVLYHYICTSLPQARRNYIHALVMQKIYQWIVLIHNHSSFYVRYICPNITL